MNASTTGQVNHRRPSSSASRAPSAPSSSASRSPLASSSSASRARATSIEPAPTWTLAQEPIRVRNPVSLSSDGPCPTRRRGVSLRLVCCLASRRSLFFQKLKHRARECASVLLCCSVAAYLHQRIDMLLWQLSRIILAWEAFPGRELVDELSKRRRRSERCPVLRITVPQKCDESGFRSLPNARIPSMGNTQVLCFLTVFAEDVDPDKVLRRYHWSRSGGQGLCDRCPRCICC